MVILGEFLRRFDYKVCEEYVHKMTIRLLHEPEQELVFDLNRGGFKVILMSCIRYHKNCDERSIFVLFL